MERKFFSDTTDVEKTKDTGGLSNSDYPDGEAEKDENVKEDDECHLGLLLSGEAELGDLKNLGLETMRIVYKWNNDNAKRSRRIFTSNTKAELSDAKNSYQALCNHLSAEQRRHVTVIRQEDGNLTANIPEIHQTLADKWRSVYNRLEDNPPSFAKFWEDFGADIPTADTGDLSPTADQLFDQAQAARNRSAPGMDGWKTARAQDVAAQCMEAAVAHTAACAETSKVAICLLHGVGSVLAQTGHNGPTGLLHAA